MLADREYRPSNAEYGLQAPNRANDFRVLFEERGISLRERSSVDPSVLVEMSLQSVGDGTESGPARRRQSNLDACRTPQAESRRVVLEFGQRLGAGIHDLRAPGDSGTISLDLGLQHATAVLDGDSVLLSTDAGRQFHHSKLLALDATGKVLRSHIEVPPRTC